MNYAAIHSRANQGLVAPAVCVEVHLSQGLPGFTVVGMPETAVRESRDRVRSALINSCFSFPEQRITANLAPADLPKGGGRFDLPIALGILAASGQLPQSALRGLECLGELTLNGALRPVSGGVAAAAAAARAGRRVVLPPESARRAARVAPGHVLSAPDLLSLCAVLRGHDDGLVAAEPLRTGDAKVPDLGDVVGQAGARRALEIAAAGIHNLLFVGPPGTGKSLLASCLPGILPPPDAEELATILALHDLQDHDGPPTRPFRAPHHSASAAALIGGGGLPRPGEVSLAHGGVLFLDELPEFSRHALDMLRQPLESGVVNLARARWQIRYPARFQLLAAMNPCPCGYAGDAQRACRCSVPRLEQYAARVSGPLLDRIDIRMRVERVPAAQLLARGTGGEASEAVRQRVAGARAVQQRRQGCANALLPVRRLMQHCEPDVAGRRLLRSAMDRFQLSARAVHRTLRVARSIADLAGKEAVDDACLSEALAFRGESDASP